MNIELDTRIALIVIGCAIIFGLFFSAYISDKISDKIMKFMDKI